MNIKEELLRRAPGADIKKPFEQWEWGSLEWAEFLNAITEKFPTEKKDRVIQELFIKKNFGALNADELEEILNGLG